MLLASPFRSDLPAKIRARHCAIAAHQLHLAEFDPHGAQQLVEIDREKARRPGCLLGTWLRRGGGHCRDVLAEQHMKHRQVAVAQRAADADAARPADQFARGEPAGYGTSPRLAASFIPVALPKRATP